MENIKNIEKYNSRMEKSMLDKMYFLDKVEADVFVDYGSADGALIAHLYPYEQNSEFIGYDNSDEMVRIAQEKLSGLNNIKFTSNENDILLNNSNKKTCLILSSVIHEVYSYGNKSSINNFWNLFFRNWSYICVRDISVSRSVDRKSNPKDVEKVRNKSKILSKKSGIDLLGTFEKIWGSIDNNKNLLHFLLKYKYDDNWDREVRENYFALYLEDFLTKIKNHPDYKMIYYKNYILPYTKNTISKDFDINITDNTHVQFILTKKSL